jgi:hypothetical protein
VFISDYPIDMIGATPVVEGQTVSQQVESTNGRAGEPRADGNSPRKDVQPPPSLPSSTSVAAMSGGLTAGASGGNSAAGALAVLVGRLLVARVGLGRVLALALSPPRPTALVQRVERPG